MHHIYFKIEFKWFCKCLGKLQRKEDTQLLTEVEKYFCGYMEISQYLKITISTKEKDVRIFNRKLAAIFLFVLKEAK